MFFRHRNLERKEKGSLPKSTRTEGERISLSPFQKRIRASVTVEMACVLPIFLFCMIEFVMLGNGFLQGISEQTQLANEAKERAVQSALLYWSEADTKEEDEEMISVEKIISIPTLFLIGEVTWIQQFQIRAWTGRDPSWTFGWNGEGEKKDERMVYVTLNGQVYHTDPKCTHIHLSIRCVQDEQLSGLRNENGEKYHACEECGGGSGNVYITDSGNRYHSSLECGGLKRTVTQVPITQTGELRPCSRCCAKMEK